MAMGLLRLVAALVLALLLAFVCALPASAGVPSAPNSTMPAALAPCPYGDVVLHFVIRDLANNPLNGAFVTLDFSNCPGAFVCPITPLDPYTLDPVGRRINQVTDTQGVADIPLRVGGTGASGTVVAYANGVLLRSYALASPDQDGDGYVVSVIGNDDPLFAAKLGGSDPTADFDGDGDVDLDDQQYFFQHHSHSCSGFVDPTTRHTWGQVKQIYR